MRLRSEALLEAKGQRPRIFVLNLGKAEQYRPRASFVRNLLAAGGIEAVLSEGFDDPDKAVAAFAETGLAAVILCGGDQVYPRLVPEVAPRIKALGARRVILAGHPEDREPKLRQGGIDSFIFRGCDVLSFLERLYLDLDLEQDREVEV